MAGTPPRGITGRRRSTADGEMLAPIEQRALPTLLAVRYLV
jgi:hypothetical protein